MLFKHKRSRYFKTSKTGEAIANEIVSTLDSLNNPLQDCRSQGNDNGANMRGAIKGVQNRVLEKKESAIFLPIYFTNYIFPNDNEPTNCIKYFDYLVTI